MNSSSWKPRKRIEEGYYADILNYLRNYFEQQPTSVERPTLLNMTQFLNKWSWQAAQRMVTGLLTDSARTWRQAASEGMQGERLYRGLRAELRGSVGAQVQQLIAGNARLIRTLPVKVAEQVTAKVSEASLAGERPENFQDQLLRHFTKTHARLIARTETSKASTALTQARSEDLGLNWWLWQTSQDQRVRQAHKKMQGVLCSWSDLPSPELLVGERSYGHYAAGNIFNCFSGDTLVRPSQCEKLFRTWYDGSMIECKTDSGAAFFATPNHPILTSRGWIAAGALNKGEKLLSVVSKVGRLLNNNDNEKLVSFDNLYSSFESSALRTTFPALRFNFYGEVPVHDVHAIIANHNLSFDFASAISEHFCNQIFPTSDCGVSAEVFNIFCNIIKSCFTSFADKFSSFLNSEPLHSEDVCFANSTHDDSVAFQEIADGHASDSIMLADVHGASSSVVSFDNFVNRQSVHPMAGASARRNSNSVSFHNASQMSDAEVLSDSFEGNTRFERTENILNLTRRQFSGHVYTLQSPTGHYTITERDICVKNCRCYPEPVLSFEQLSWPHRAYISGRVQYVTRAQFRVIARIPNHQHQMEAA